MKVIELNEYEHWIGESVKACIEAAAAEHGLPITDESYEDARELDDDELDLRQIAVTNASDEKRALTPIT
jgi:hypothetical protein